MFSVSESSVCLPRLPQREVVSFPTLLCSECGALAVPSRPSLARPTVGWFPRRLRTAGQLDVSRRPEQRQNVQRHTAQSPTVSHFALARSSSNFANSFRSWMVMRSFQMSRVARPMSRMAPITESRTTRMSGPLGHSVRRQQRAQWLWLRQELLQQAKNKSFLTKQ